MLKKSSEVVKSATQEDRAGGEKRSFLQPVERVGIDFTDMLKVKDGNSKILVMIDHATKFVIVKATQNG